MFAPGVAGSETRNTDGAEGNGEQSSLESKTSP